MYPQKRRSAYRPLLKKFVISCEGGVTEKEYFERVRALAWDKANLDILTDRHKSSPVQVLERLKNYSKSLQSGDEMWCVVDKDNWTNYQFAELEKWAAESGDGVVRRIALSDPKFEVWLLAHFQPLPDSCGPSECIRLLRQYLPNYDKHLDKAAFSLDSMACAIRNAKDSFTSVGELIERILQL